MTVPIDADMNMNTNTHNAPINMQMNINVQMQQPQRQAVVVAGYTLQQKLGSGSFATVYKAVKVIQDSDSDGHDPSGTSKTRKCRTETVAIKAIDFQSNKITKKVLENLDLEISILTTYQHPNIVCLHQSHKTERYIHLILEYCAGGDLQGLIRSRKSGRLSEGLARRLMRDLTSGLTFLAEHHLIHRDIKPQNLLLTGTLPVEEVNDPIRSDLEHTLKGIGNRSDGGCAGSFHLKIADFGFARHLKKTSLADTLCGSPLYMAPEILQHRSYDNKADLWSVGTVLFEMIAGRPPFHGENHMDLLRNIQSKAVRLPPDLKVSKECVQLLRILLNRNPLARAGFQDFMKASDAFVGLGCHGEPAVISGVGTRTSSVTGVGVGSNSVAPMSGIKNLGPISEVEESYLHNSSHVNVDSHTPTSPALIPVHSTTTSAGLEEPQHHSHAYNNHNGPRVHSHFTPLEPSPPGPKHISTPDGLIPPMSLYRKSDSQHSQTNSDDSSSGGFVMVEKGSSNAIASNSSATSTRMDERKLSRSPLTMWKQSSNRRVVPASALSGNSSPPASPRPSSNRFFSGKTLLSTRNMIPPSIPFVRKGMLSTSPGTGGALVGMMGATNKVSNAIAIEKGGVPTSEALNFEAAAKMLSAADDVGRRAINVAHVGDTRAYLAMRFILSNESTRSLQTSSGMESLVEETDVQLAEHDEFSVPNRARTISSDNSASNRNRDQEEDEDDEMPFAMGLDDEDEESLPNILAIRKCSSDCKEEDCNMTANAAKSKLSSTSAILVHFRQALSCYMKALSMLKGSVNASQQLLCELNRSSVTASSHSKTESFISFSNRCNASHNWLTGQFKGVLERADAANSEIAKIVNQNGTAPAESNMSSGSVSIMTAEELIYNHSLACGKDGAVKQLLGQYDNARSCYRSAGLLAETLLMEPKIVDEDRKVLEEYVHGFSERINEIDCLMLHQSKHSVGSTSSNRGTVGSTTSSRRSSFNSAAPLVGQHI